MPIDLEDLPRSERKVQYLLLQLGVPERQYPASTKHIAASKLAARSMGIKLSRVRFAGSSQAGPSRYMFRFPWYKRDDNLANRIAESVIYAANITCYPFGDSHEPALVLPIPAEMTKDPSRLALGDIIEVERLRPPQLQTVEYPDISIGSVTLLPDTCATAAWKAAPVLFKREEFHKAARFLKGSQDNFYVWPGQYLEALCDDQAAPQSGWEQTRLEDALLSAFKSVEALLGAPPSDDRRLISKIQALGINPEEPFGHPHRVPLYAFIELMGRARDTRSAHGSTPHGPILVRDLFLFQDCARYLLTESIEAHLGASIY